MLTALDQVRLLGRIRLPLIFLLAVVISIAQSSATDSASRTIVETIKVGGPDGWDYATFDELTHILYIAHGSGVASLNATTKAINPHLADAQGAHIAVPFAGGSRLLVTHGKANQITLNDAKTGAVDATIPTDAKPDAALVEPTTGRGFVMANGGGTVDVIDLDTKAVVARIAVGGAPEAAAYDGQGLVFTHLEDHNAIVVIDAKAMKIKATYPMNGCEDPSGIAAIPKRNLILSACANQIVRITNATTGAAVASLPLGKHPDSAFWDEDRQVGYVPCGDGTLTVIGFKEGVARVTEVVVTEPGARTGALDPKSGLVYLPTSEFGAPEKPGGRPSIVPNTFKVLVIGSSPQKDAHQNR
jgi:DNA-binding beta-propeller fold protein YncE